MAGAADAAINVAVCSIGRGHGGGCVRTSEDDRQSVAGERFVACADKSLSADRCLARNGPLFARCRSLASGRPAGSHLPVTSFLCGEAHVVRARAAKKPDNILDEAAPIRLCAQVTAHAGQVDT